jgi:murein DD-endopeptidase MepM/ murein hydrolase activator NlpD
VLRRRLASLIAFAFAALAACGSDETFTAEEFVSAVNAEGAGISLGEPLSSGDEGLELYALTLSAPTAGGSSAGADLHGGGSLRVTEGADDAEAEYERCEGAVTLACYQAANIVVAFEGLTAEERARLDRAFSALSSEPGEAEEQPVEDAAPTAATAGDDADDPTPSGKARRVLGAADLDVYRTTGTDLGLDWTVIAAVDLLERGARSSVPAAERIPAIGYQLQGLGAPSDYRVALEARTSAAFARRVLALAETLGSERALGRAPAARGRLELPQGTVVAGYGARYGVVHDGIDIEAPDGSRLSVAANGIVVSAGFSPLYGNQTCVAHRLVPMLEGEDRIQTCYGNQSRMDVAPGDVVRQGETIGAVGCSGPCLRPHVHFRVLLGTGEAARATDPAPFLVPAADAKVPGRPLE